jgi:hypothetical protein
VESFGIVFTRRQCSLWCSQNFTPPLEHGFARDGRNSKIYFYMRMNSIPQGKDIQLLCHPTWPPSLDYCSKRLRLENPNCIIHGHYANVVSVRCAVDCSSTNCKPYSNQFSKTPFSFFDLNLRVHEDIVFGEKPWSPAVDGTTALVQILTETGITNGGVSNLCYCMKERDLDGRYSSGYL